ncbi:MAG TPA: S-adenosylmethionine:tRNA ribosyltransferase-isomerase [Bacteroidia bacterium]|nr:S-adenosylmethionine:tRNA ribosyltransferase-isomerase [Bacteroidia bacterium]
MMQDPRHLSILNFTYDLPDHRIAAVPLECRSDSKLLIFKEENVSSSLFNDLSNYLPANSMLVFNNTKVILARLIFIRSTGARIECFCLEPEAGITPEISFRSHGSCRWWAMIGNAKKWKAGEIIENRFSLNGTEIVLTAKRLEVKGQESLVEFHWTPTDFAFSEILEGTGILPLPPYMNREACSDELIRYNTVYAKHDGSVAAPTAGLHFTDEILSELQSKNVDLAYLTLHVGAGTFKPVKSDTMAEHDMHAERLIFTDDFIDRLIAQKESGKVIPVGTTATRSLESLYWWGVKILNGTAVGNDIDIHQWEPYDYDSSQLPSTIDALTAVKKRLKESGANELTGFTRIIIAPGYQFHVIDALITNFHQPQSTLLLLVSALVGDAWKDIYQYAMDNDFRFLSYGDSSLLFPAKK